MSSWNLEYHVPDYSNHIKLRKNSALLPSQTTRKIAGNKNRLQSKSIEQGFAVSVVERFLEILPFAEEAIHGHSGYILVLLYC